MKRMAALALVASLALGRAPAVAAEFKTTGDARIWANEWSTPKGTTPSGPSGSLTLWERFRMRTDFVASEGLKFRLGIRVNNNGQLQNFGNGAR